MPSTTSNTVQIGLPQTVIMEVIAEKPAVTYAQERKRFLVAGVAASLLMFVLAVFAA